MHATAMTCRQAVTGSIAVVLCLGAFGCGRPSLPPPRDPPSSRLVVTAVRSGDRASASALLEQGADPNTVDLDHGDKPTLLVIACLESSAEMVETLLSLGADPNRRIGASIWGRSPLMIAAQRGDARMVGALLNAGARVDARAGLLGPSEATETAMTALRFALSSEHARDVVRELLLAGAAVTDADLVASVTTGQWESLRLMLRARGYAPPRHLLSAASDEQRSELSKVLREFSVR